MSTDDERPPVKIRIIISARDNGAPLITVRSNLVERNPGYPAALRAALAFQDHELTELPTPEDDAAEDVAINLELAHPQIGETFERELDAHGFAAAVQCMRDLAAEQTRVTGIPFEVCDLYAEHSKHGTRQ